MSVMCPRRSCAMAVSWIRTDQVISGQNSHTTELGCNWSFKYTSLSTSSPKHGVSIYLPMALKDQFRGLLCFGLTRSSKSSSYIASTPVPLCCDDYHQCGRGIPCTHTSRGLEKGGAKAGFSPGFERMPTCFPFLFSP